MLKFDSDFVSSKILKETYQSEQIFEELRTLHPNLKAIKLIYQGSRAGYDPTFLEFAARDYNFTFSVI